MIDLSSWATLFFLSLLLYSSSLFLILIHTIITFSPPLLLDLDPQLIK